VRLQSLWRQLPFRALRLGTSSEERGRQQLNDTSLPETDDDANAEEDRIEAPGTEEDDEVTPLRTRIPENCSKDRDPANEAGRKGGQR
jgi:hypothetical protein